jgi:hypothetical protein
MPELPDPEKGITEIPDGASVSRSMFLVRRKILFQVEMKGFIPTIPLEQLSGSVQLIL